MLKAVLFDMDDTLLSINLSAFCAVWGKDVSGILAAIGRKNAPSTLAGMARVMYELNTNDRKGTDNRTNRAFFNESVRMHCGVDLNDSVVFEALDYYERDILPTRNGRLINAHPRKGAHQALDAVASRGLRTALFTNPSFSATGIRCRMGWGELLDAPFELVTSMENSTRVKPSPVYYLESLEKLGLEPHEVLMVGNDPKRDIPVPYCGIETAYVGKGAPSRALWHGSMVEFAQQLDDIIELFDARNAERS